MLSTNLTNFVFGEDFNQPIEQGVLPKNLEKLIFGRYFNQPIKKGILPCSLIKLTLGCYFDQSMEEDVLPMSLTNLIFGYKTDSSGHFLPLKKNINQLLRKLEFESKFNLSVQIIPEKYFFIKNWFKHIYEH